MNSCGGICQLLSFWLMFSSRVKLPNWAMWRVAMAATGLEMEAAWKRVPVEVAAP